MSPPLQRAAYLTRRQFFSRTATGIGTVALADLLTRDGLGAAAFPASGSDVVKAAAAHGAGGLPGLPHFAPKARHVIYLLQNGGPPHLDMFDYKPQMEQFR